MGFLIRAAEGQWGGAGTADILAVVRSTADAFNSVPGELERAILVEATPLETDQPVTLSSPNAFGEIVVRLNVRGNLWAKLSYQFAHELCHVLADPTSWTVDHLTWIEEAVCETASLFALRSMARVWAASPPHLHWRDYSAALADYAADRILDPRHSLPPGADLKDWLAERLPLLEADAYRREDNTIIAKELLPIFESDRSAWHTVRYLHAPPRGTLVDFAHGWRLACPPVHRRSVDAIAAVLGAT